MTKLQRIDKTELLKQLQNYGQAFLQERFGMDLDIPIEINNRLSSSGGRFRWRSNGHGGYKAVDIQIARFVFEVGDKHEINDILEHELIHYALFTQGKPFRDKDHYFIETCRQHDVRLSHNIKKAIHTYTCNACGTIIDMRRPIPKGYCTLCKECGNRITKQDFIRKTENRVRRIT